MTNKQQSLADKLKNWWTYKNGSTIQGSLVRFDALVARVRELEAALKAAEEGWDKACMTAHDVTTGLEAERNEWQRVAADAQEQTAAALERERSAGGDYAQIRHLQRKAVAAARREALEAAKEAAAVDDGLSYVAVCNLLDKEPKT